MSSLNSLCEFFEFTLQTSKAGATENEKGEKEKENPPRP
jgi:hypothetical protein